MSAELIGIISVGVALGGLILMLGNWLRSDIRDLAGQVAELDRRVSRIEGLFEGAALFRATGATEPASGD